jgi:predicted PhzF superfamily epimerase YddE/YHI9
VSFRTRCAGTLTVARRDGWLELDFPARVPRPCEPPAGLLAGLGGAPREVLQSERDLLVVFDTEAEVVALAPHMDSLARLGRSGVIASAPGREHDFVSRFFAPAFGIDEDPVTGSAHCVLIPYWAARLGRTELTARQVSRRGGNLRCTLRGERVGIAGTVVPYLRGTITVPR